MFPVSRMPKNGEDWPTVDDMVQKNQRLVVFTSKSAKEASEGIAYQWTYVVENQCQFPPWKNVLLVFEFKLFEYFYNFFSFLLLFEVKNCFLMLLFCWV